MTNEQYSNMMIAFAKLEAKVEKLEAVFSELLKSSAVENTIENKTEIKPEHLSNFWNGETVRQFNQTPNFLPDVLILENEK